MMISFDPAFLPWVGLAALDMTYRIRPSASTSGAGQHVQQAVLTMETLRKPISFQRIGSADDEKQRNQQWLRTDFAHELNFIYSSVFSRSSVKRDKPVVV
jgi:hypothetical protein